MPSENVPSPRATKERMSVWMSRSTSLNSPMVGPRMHTGGAPSEGADVLVREAVVGGEVAQLEVLVRHSSHMQRLFEGDLALDALSPRVLARHNATEGVSDGHNAEADLPSGQTKTLCPELLLLGHVVLPLQVLEGTAQLEVLEHPSEGPGPGALGVELGRKAPGLGLGSEVCRDSCVDLPRSLSFEPVLRQAVEVSLRDGLGCLPKSAKGGCSSTVQPSGSRDVLPAVNGDNVPFAVAVGFRGEILSPRKASRLSVDGRRK